VRRAILIFLLAAPVVSLALLQTSPLGALGVLMLSHAFVLYPTLRANAQWLGPVITCFEATEPEVWLTIDDGPGEDTHAILDLLDARGAKATFFCKGVLAEQHPELLRAMATRQSVGNHSYSHPSGSFWALPPGRIRVEIERANEVMRAITGRTPRWFRAPVGMKNPFVHPLLSETKQPLIGWSARGFDTQSSDPAAIAARVLRGARPGAIVLMHQGLPHSVAALANVIDDLEARGYRFVVPDDGRLKTKR
jgi:peptidoglycan/xylan/chitin deacetylase (PgdA/CDA1 family)